jgi:hypothetical protein
MVKVFSNQNIILAWIPWQFSEMPKNILKAWRNFLVFNLNYFSVPLLLKTLFSPWRRYQWSYGRGFDAGRYLYTFFSNMISRVLGAVMRSFLILIALIIEFFIFWAGIFVFFGWLVFPLLLLAGLWFGLKILF